MPGGRGHIGHQGFPGGHADQGLAQHLRQAFRQSNGGAQAGKAARPNANGHGIQGGWRYLRFTQNLLDHGWQMCRLAARGIMQSRRQYRAIPQHGRGTTRQRPFNGKDEHVQIFLARPWP
jgi:hypothetical protein